MYRQNYPAKVLLFGEHTVLRGGHALAVPNPAFGLQWVLNRKSGSDHRLLALLRFLQQNNFDRYLQLALLAKDLKKGWRLAGNVPHGYGLGSSGVVCAAVWHRYGNTAATDLGPVDLRNQLAKMEGHYHGSSSGTDPLISYLERPAVLSSAGLEIVDLPNNWSEGFFLLDTRKPRHSAPLIRHFTQRFDAESAWREKAIAGWMKLSDSCIDAVLSGDRGSLWQSFNQLGELQAAEVPDFIPEPVRAVWQGKHHCLKLCGAGGGGFMLGLSNNWAETEIVLSGWALSTLA